jgi:hypothetical protein
LTLAPLREAFHAVRDGLVDMRLLDDMSRNVCWYLTAPVLVNEWRRVQRDGTFGQEFAAHLNGRFAKLHPEACEDRNLKRTTQSETTE